MKFYYDKPESCIIKKRTFEGKTDPDKNADSLTSKYMPSYKYWVELIYETGRHAVATFRTKTEAEAFYAKALKMAGQPL